MGQLPRLLASKEVSDTFRREKPARQGFGAWSWVLERAEGMFWVSGSIPFHSPHITYAPPQHK